MTDTASPSNVETAVSPAAQPLNHGDIVHVRPTDDELPPERRRCHRYACRIADVHDASSDSVPSYTLYSIVLERELPDTYAHKEVIPSPRGYDYINQLLGDRGSNETAAQLLADFKRPDLHLINRCLSVVDFETDATKGQLLGILLYIRMVYLELIFPIFCSIAPLQPK